MRALFNGADDPTTGAMTGIHQLAKKWISLLESEGTLKSGSITHYANRLRRTLGLLSAKYPWRFPAVPKGFLKRKETSPENHESLGDQDWPELEGLKGAARERAALNIVRKEALAYFEELETLFWFGHDLLTSAEPPATTEDPKAWRALQGRVKNAVKTGHNRRERSGPGSASIVDPNLWRAAGLKIDVDRRMPLVLRRVGKLIDFCLAPTLDLCHLVAVIYCCATNWNRQPIFDMARKPFVFENNNKVGVTTASFLSEMKIRAGHEVFAYMESDKHLSSVELENVKSVIRAAELKYRHYDHGAFEELDRDSEGLDVLTRFIRIVDNIPPELASQEYKNYLFVYRANGKFRSAAQSKKAISGLRLFERRGIDYPAIRRTVLNLRLRRVGSIDALSALASHDNTATLMPHYTNLDETIEGYTETIRFKQNSVQALLLKKRKKLQIRLSLSDADIEWYLMMSKISGIGAAMLPVTITRTPGGATYNLDPSPDALLTHYLIIFSLVNHRLSGFDRTRWFIQGRPQLILARGVKRAIVDAGLAAAWNREAKRGFRGLKDGTIKLPKLLWA